MTRDRGVRFEEGYAGPTVEAHAWSGKAQVIINAHFIVLDMRQGTPEDRQNLEDALRAVGFLVDGGGTDFARHKSEIFLRRGLGLPAAYCEAKAAKLRDAGV